MDKKAELIVVLEEDDEFQEFESENWDGNCEKDDLNKVPQQWQDDWDIQVADDDFSKQLRLELERQSKK